MPHDHSAELAALAAAIPPVVAGICRKLDGAGYQAFAVGGAVRDTLLGRQVGDWDVATDAHPDNVQELFDKVLPTGIEHGTVTILEGRGRHREAIEVTTFRAEGPYVDGRRPTEVAFGVSLREDLARRDFVINAMAFDPVAGVLADPFGGIHDIGRRIIRAVGDPVERFAEDGLRIMRAVRFVATLEFELAPATEAAISGALSSLAKVSRERVHVEMEKLMAARKPSLGLAVALRTGILDSVLWELAGRSESRWLEVFATIDRMGTSSWTRTAALLMADDASDEADAAASKRAETIGRRLKWSNAERSRVVLLVRLARPAAWFGLDAAATRKRLARIGREAIADLQAVLAADDRDEAAASAELVGDIVRAGHALSVAELTVTGGELISIAGLEPGPKVGQTLRALLDEVLAEPSRNQPKQLLARARELVAADD